MWTAAESVSPRVVEVAHTGSTNADMRASIDEWPHLGVLLTRDQRTGRGRLDRVWEAAAGASLAISVALDVARIPVERRGWIPLAAGTAMATAVGNQLPMAGVKWPNDVLVGGRKICGILAEVAKADRIVVGSGVNTEMTAGELPVPTATSFAVEGTACDEDRLLTDYLVALRDLADALATGSIRDAVRERCVTIGQRVTAHLPGGERLTGTASDLDDAGRIVVAGRALAAADIVHLR